MCNRHSHKECHHNEPVPKKGHYFICSLCVSKTKQVEPLATPVSVNQTKPIPPAPDVSITSSHSSNSSSSFHNDHGSPTDVDRGRDHDRHRDSHDVDRDNRDRDHRDKKDDEPKMCPLYADNVCPHGISGRGCSFKHPPRCFKYSKHGEHPRLGCIRGPRCWYFHPASVQTQ